VGNGVVLGLTGRLSESNLGGLYHLLCHELLHWWIAGSVADESTYWFSEGFTDYYTWIMQRRIGLVSQEQWYDHLYRIWQNVCGNPRLREISLSEASLSYFDDRAASRLCYDKGMCLAFILDVKIRRYTRNRRSLNDMIRKMVRYIKEHGLTFCESDILSVIDEVAGRSMRDFYQRYVYGTDMLPFRRYLKLAGMTMQEYTESYLGYGFSFGTRRDNTPPIVILEVPNGNPARQVGLRCDDEIIEIEGEAVTSMKDADAIILRKHGRMWVSEGGKGTRITHIVARGGTGSLTMKIQRGRQLRDLKMVAENIEEVKERIGEFASADQQGKDILAALVTQT